MTSRVTALDLVWLAQAMKNDKQGHCFGPGVANTGDGERQGLVKSLEGPRGKRDPVEVFSLHPQSFQTFFSLPSGKIFA